ncbi:hypothetical protein EVA_05794 [gut metagenome]|uniref:Uncharacterized protein n=1 Tax=gut metagenome TaxID=749906 RepID=J9D0L9_9ZZZZ
MVTIGLGKWMNDTLMEWRMNPVIVNRLGKNLMVVLMIVVAAGVNSIICWL